MANPIKILIQTLSQPGGINATIKGLDQLKQATQGVENVAARAKSALAGMVASVVGIGTLTAVFKGAVEKGVAFNRTLEDAQLGIAAILKQFQPKAFSNFADAMKASAEAIEALKVKAAESPASFSQLVGGFQAITGAATGAKIALKDQVELVVLLSQSLAGLGIRSEQLIQESRALITGNINQDAAAAKILGITKQQIDEATKAGRLFEFLKSKLSAFAEAGKIGATNFSNAISNLGDIIEQRLGKLTVPIFEAIKKGALDLAEAVKKADLERAFSGIATAIAAVTSALFTLGKFGVENITLIKIAVDGLLVSLGLLTLHLGSKLIPKILGFSAGVAMAVTGAGQLVDKAVRLGVMVKTLAGRVALVGSAFAGWELGKWMGHVDLFGTKIEKFGLKLDDLVQLHMLRAMRSFKSLRTLFGFGNDFSVEAIDQTINELLAPKPVELKKPWERKRQTEDEKKRTKEQFEEERKLMQLEHERAQLDIERLQTVGAHRELLEQELQSLENAQVSNRIKSLEMEADTIRALILAQKELIRSRQEGLKEAVDAGIISTEEARELELQDATALLAIEQQLLKLEQELKDIHEEKLKLIDEVIRKKSEEAQIEFSRLQGQRSLIESDPTLLRKDRQQQLLPLLQREIDLIGQQIRLNEDRVKLDDPEVQIEAKRELVQLEQQRVEALRQIQEIEREGSFVGSLQLKWNEFIDRAGTTAQNLADLVMSPFEGLQSGIRNALQGMLEGTMTVADGIRSIWNTVVSSIIQSFSDMVAKWVTTHIVMKGIALAWSAFKSALGAKDVAESNAREAAKAPGIWANALGSSIGSFGVAVAIGVAAIAAIMAGIGAFAQGGVVHGGEQIIRVNEGNRKESVLNARATAALGEPLINALNAGLAGASQLEARIAGNMAASLPSDSVSAAASRSSRGGGAAVAGSSDESRMIQFSFAFVDNRRQAEEYLESQRGQGRIIELNRENRMEFGVET